MAVKAWMRVLRITLTTKSPGQNGKNKQLVFEENESGVGLAISVNGNKFMSTLKDNCTVKISNLTYVEIVQIITGQFYNIKIECDISRAVFRQFLRVGSCTSRTYERVSTPTL